jgi:C-terminal processing protease CtpA/Prc
MNAMKKKLHIWITIAVALIAFAAGLLVDHNYLNPATKPDRRNPKVKAILDLIEREYVDTVNPEKLMERSIPLILRGLDHHTSYFDAQNSKISRNHPDGVIPDIGAVLIIFNDTIHVE